LRGDDLRRDQTHLKPGVHTPVYALALLLSSAIHSHSSTMLLGYKGLYLSKCKLKPNLKLSHSCLSRQGWDRYQAGMGLD